MTLALLACGSASAPGTPPPEWAARLAEPTPIEARDEVFIDRMTWMEVRDAIAGGATTALVPSGGIESNGPWLVTGKHNIIAKADCEAIARALGSALCTPVLRLVPQGSIDPPSSHMFFPGTLSLRASTFEAVLEDVAGSLRAHGIEHIVFFGDSGGNQEPMKRVAERLNEAWTDAQVHMIAAYYDNEATRRDLEQRAGIAETRNDGLHDDAATTALLMTSGVHHVRLEERLASGSATINGVDLSEPTRMVEAGRILRHARVQRTVEAIREAVKPRP